MLPIAHFCTKPRSITTEPSLWSQHGDVMVALAEDGGQGMRALLQQVEGLAQQLQGIPGRHLLLVH